MHFGGLLTKELCTHGTSIPCLLPARVKNVKNRAQMNNTNLFSEGNISVVFECPQNVIFPIRS